MIRCRHYRRRHRRSSRRMRKEPQKHIYVNEWLISSEISWILNRKQRERETRRQSKNERTQCKYIGSATATTTTKNDYKNNEKQYLTEYDGDHVSVCVCRIRRAKYRDSNRKWESCVAINKQPLRFLSNFRIRFTCCSKYESVYNTSHSSYNFSFLLYLFWFAVVAVVAAGFVLRSESSVLTSRYCQMPAWLTG